MADADDRRDASHTIEMPAPNPWPFTAAFAVAFAFAGIVTDPVLSVVGGALFLLSAAQGVREILPRERTEAVPVVPEEAVVGPRRAAPRPGEERHRLRLPVEVRPYSAGLRGGLAGAVAMAAVALLYGFVGERGPWYPINLLAAVVVPSLAAGNPELLRAFSALGLAVASVVHLLVSLLVGLLYAVLLPMLPGSPLVWGAIVAPLLWSGGLWGLLGWIDPVLESGLSWPWFVASQLAFGVACGLVVSRSERIHTLQSRPLAERAGLERGGEPSREDRS